MTRQTRSERAWRRAHDKWVRENCDADSAIIRSVNHTLQELFYPPLVYRSSLKQKGT